ncbi:hypothetical protein ACHAWF_014241 [Thalassiosira exigua]
MPGLGSARQKRGCDFPGGDGDAASPVRPLVLSDRVRSARSGRPASEPTGLRGPGRRPREGAVGLGRSPRKSKVETSHDADPKSAEGTAQDTICAHAFDGDDDRERGREGAAARDREGAAKRRLGLSSSRFAGRCANDEKVPGDARGGVARRGVRDGRDRGDFRTRPSARRGDRPTPRNSSDDGIDVALESVAGVERTRDTAVVYLSAARPDRRCRALGVERDEAAKAARGIEREVERFRRVLLQCRDAPSSGENDAVEIDDRGSEWNRSDASPADASVVVTADPGHIAVEHGDMTVFAQRHHRFA